METERDPNAISMSDTESLMISNAQLHLTFIDVVFIFSVSCLKE